MSLMEKQTAQRTRPMRVLCLGQSRTGTMSMYTALTDLGYKPYHMIEALKNPAHDFPLWEEGLNAKFQGQGKPWGLREFDVMLGNFDALLDIPCTMFADELIKLYPDAKVLLTTRDVDSWLKSMRGIGVVFSWNWWVARFDPAVAGPWYHFVQAILESGFPKLGTGFSDYEPNGRGRDYFINHYNHIREITPKDRLFEHHPKMGYGPLCDFLEIETPKDEPYPHINDTLGFRELHAKIWWAAFGKAVLKIGAVAAPIAAASWWYMSTGRAPTLGLFSGLSK
ncbi:MAG: hypothetical protein M1828_005061 [Chrysothrix sp. TS-e1954]|nr:MAG: hypothetical protein M1828_005061 [Chrysothrix sp. TS-e1954]